MSRIVKIENIDTPEYVYDPICHAPHAYIANGLVSHNCDEIDKGLGGMGSTGDSGVSSRVLGTYLTWLQENKKPVFSVVTANNIEGLPPELLRRGRFDEIFSTGFPRQEERREILAIHLRKRKRSIKDFPKSDVVGVLNATRGYLPAEIESAVEAALIDAFSEEEEFTMDHVVKALNDMKRLADTFNVVIQKMAKWMKENARPASKEYESTSNIGDSEGVSQIRKRRTRIRKKTEENDDE